MQIQFNALIAINMNMLGANAPQKGAGQIQRRTQTARLRSREHSAPPNTAMYMTLGSEATLDAIGSDVQMAGTATDEAL